MKRSNCLLVLMLWLCPILLLGQGLVNVNNRGLPTPQLVTIPDSGGGAAQALVGTQWVAQIVYGPSNLPLGDPMPFRGSTTASPGTWNPGAQGIRTLQGFDIGANVTMQVRVWDSSVFSSWAEAAEALAAGAPPATGETAVGSSSPFTYTVGSSTNPASLTLQNFRGFTLTRLWCLCPPPCYASVSVHLTVENTGSPVELNLWTNLLAAAWVDSRATNIGPLTAASPVGALIEGNPNPRDPVVCRFGVLSGSLAQTVLTWDGTMLGQWSAPVTRSVARPYQRESFDPANGIYTPSQCGWNPGIFELVAVPPGGRSTLGIRRLTPFRYELHVRGRSQARYIISRSFDLTNFTPITEFQLGYEGEVLITNRYDSTPNARVAFWKLD